MVVRITPTSRLSDVLAYNENKVTQNKAELIKVGNFLQEKDELSHDEKLERFQHRSELNSRAKLKMFHATLNFNPSDKLSDEKMIAIAERYMEGLKMEQQPYLVYRHDDAEHPHVHIVSSLIRADGSRINTHLMAVNLSEPVRKEIEIEFDLKPNKRLQQLNIPNLSEVQKIHAGSGIPISESMDIIVGAINRDFKFTSLEEYSAILRNYNITVETGGPDSKTYRHHGLYYVALDDQGNKISPPVMASTLSSRPTYARLEEKFQYSIVNQNEYSEFIQSRINWALIQNPSNFRDFIADLWRDNINVVSPPYMAGVPEDYIYIDFFTKAAVKGQSLGDSYTAKSIHEALSFDRSQATDRTSQNISYPSADDLKIGESDFNSRVPQVIYELFKSVPDQEQHQQTQQLRRGMRM